MFIYVTVWFYLSVSGPDSAVIAYNYNHTINKSESSEINSDKCNFKMEFNDTFDTLSVVNGTEDGSGYNKSDGGYSYDWFEAGRIQIPFYSFIFMFSVIGNTLVILTLVSSNYNNCYLFKLRLDLMCLFYG